MWWAADASCDSCDLVILLFFWTVFHLYFIGFLCYYSNTIHYAEPPFSAWLWHNSDNVWFIPISAVSPLINMNLQHQLLCWGYCQYLYPIQYLMEAVGAMYIPPTYTKVLYLIFLSSIVLNYVGPWDVFTKYWFKSFCLALSLLWPALVFWSCSGYNPQVSFVVMSIHFEYWW